jgi:Zn-dependent protease
VIYHLVVLGFDRGFIQEQGVLFQIAEPVFLMARVSVGFNLVLMVINLIPIPPLDGGRILVGLLPERAAFQVARLERYGMLIVLLLIMTKLWGYLINPVLSLFLRFFLD